MTLIPPFLRDRDKVFGPTHFCRQCQKIMPASVALDTCEPCFEVIKARLMKWAEERKTRLEKSPTEWAD